MVLQHVGGAGEAHVRRVVGRLLALPRMVQVAQGGEGVGPGNAVGGQAQVQLELAQRQLRVGAEDAVHRAAGEAERAQSLLQFQHVVPVEIGHAQIQRPVAQAKRGVHQRRPHLFVHAVGRRHPLRLAERAHRPCRDVAVHAVDALLRKEAERGQALLHVFHGRPGVVSLNSVHARHGSALRPAAESGAACFHQSNRAARCRRAARPARGRGGGGNAGTGAAPPRPCRVRSRRSRSRTPRAAKAGR